MPRPPPEHEELFSGMNDHSKKFLKHIHQYNATFAFTSLGANMDRTLDGGGGPYVFKIHGKLYHWHGSLIPEADANAVYAQLYI